MMDYTPNSHKYKNEQTAKADDEKRVEKVVKGKTKSKKKSEIRKLTDIFISEDAGNVKSYVIMDVLIPAIKKAVSDIVTNGIDMILYGETGHTKKSSASKISYGKYYDREKERDYRDRYRYRSGVDFNDIIFESRGDAEAVLMQMDEILSKYHVVSVLDLYDLADVSGAPHTANKFGWTDLRNVRPIRTRDGEYMLDLPKAMPID